MRGRVLLAAVPLMVAGGCATSPETGPDAGMPLAKHYGAPDYETVDDMVLHFAGDWIVNNDDQLVPWFRAHNSADWCEVADNEFKGEDAIEGYRQRLREYTTQTELDERDRTFVLVHDVKIGEYDFERQAFPLVWGGDFSRLTFEYDYKDWWGTGGGTDIYSRSPLRCSDNDMHARIFTKWHVDFGGKAVKNTELPMKPEHAEEVVNRIDDRRLKMALTVTYDGMKLDDVEDGEPVFQATVKRVELYERVAGRHNPGPPFLEGDIARIDYAAKE